MTNQAAQTMPSNIVERLASAKDKLPAGSDERMAVWRAIEYFRALSQTAGVAEGWPRDWRWAVQFARSVIDTERECREPIGRDRAQYTRTMNVLDAMLAAAPAASGGEVWTREMVADVHRRGEELYRRIHGANPPPAAPSASGGEDGLDRVARRMGDSARALLRDIAEQQSAASVSERARALLAASYRESGDKAQALDVERRIPYVHHAIALRALEQALTQQRGSVPDARPTLQYDDEGNGEYNYNEGWNDCRSAMLSGTTPQPSADAVRELVKRILNWQPLTSINKADRLYQILIAAGIPFESITDELESLLSAASGEKGVVGA